MAINDNPKHVTNNKGNGNMNRSQLSALDNNDSIDSGAGNTRGAENFVTNQNIRALDEITDDKIDDFLKRQK